MADEPDKSGQEPNLELPPLLSFGRNRKKRKGERGQDEPTTAPLAPSQPAGEPATGAPEGRQGIVPSTDRAKRLPPVPPPTARTQAPTEQIPVAPPAPIPRAHVEETTVLPVQHPGPDFIEVETTQVRTLPEEPAAARVDESLSEPVGDPAGERRPARGLTSPSLPTMAPRLACVVTGVLVGLLGVLLAYFASRGCETVRGVGSCGGIGLLALLLIVTIEVVLGAILLKAWQISDPTSTSFLGVGLVTVFVLLFLLSSLESVWMLVVIPVLSGLAFLLSWWVTTALVEVPGEETRR